jgi:chorismate mutase
MILEQEYGTKNTSRRIEGVGEIGWNGWKSKEETGLLMGTEVANAAHCKTSFRIWYWIMGGSQNNGETFAMQEIRYMFKGTKKIK